MPIWSFFHRTHWWLIWQRLLILSNDLSWSCFGCTDSRFLALNQGGWTRIACGNYDDRQCASRQWIVLQSEVLESRRLLTVCHIDPLPGFPFRRKVTELLQFIRLISYESWVDLNLAFFRIIKIWLLRVQGKSVVKDALRYDTARNSRSIWIERCSIHAVSLTELLVRNVR